MTGSPDSWYAHMQHTLEAVYLQHEEPWKQSGFLGSEERWNALRKPVADCIDASGSFLDIGCANGYLLECCLKWVSERGLELDPYGLDISADLVSLAKRRVPGFEDHFFTGNAMEWLPQRKYDFVRTELVYVPADREKEYIRFLLDNHLNEGGKLFVANYSEGREDIESLVFEGAHPTRYIIERLSGLGFEVSGYQDGYDTVKGRKTRIAVIQSH